MTCHVNPDLSEDEFIALLCGEFGGIGTSILQEATSIRPTQDMKFDDKCGDCGDATTEAAPSANAGDSSVSSGQMIPCRWSAEIETAHVALVEVLDNIITASELESINLHMELISKSTLA